MKGRALVVALIAVVAVAMFAWRSCRTSADEGARVDDNETASSSSARERRIVATIAGRASIAGTVRDEAGTGIASARVCAEGSGPRVLPAIGRSRCVTSDERGVYRFADLYPIAYRVSAMARSYQPAFHKEPTTRLPDFELRAGEHREDVDVVLEAGGLEVIGIVADLDGGPIAHARVYGLQETAEPMVESDSTGRFSMWVAPTELDVYASADGYASAWKHVSPPGTIEIALVAEATVSGTVVDAVTGEPVTGADVAFTASIEYGWTGLTGDRTDEQGHFQLERLSSDRYIFSAMTAHGFGQTEQSQRVGVGEHLDGVVIKLYPAVRVSGHVTSPGCGMPSLSLFGPEHTYRIDGDRDGGVELESVMPGTYALSVSCAGFLSLQDSIEVKREDMRGLTWKLEPASTIRGRVVTHGGRPLADVVVYTEEGTHTSRTGHDGRYELHDIEPGAHRLEVNGQRFEGGIAEVNVQVRAGEAVEKDLIIDEVGAIEGIVVDDAGVAVADAFVMAHEVDLARAHIRTTKTRGDGQFTFSAVPDGAYVVAAADDHPATVTVRSPGVTEARLVVEARQGVIRGDVVDAAGRPVMGAKVWPMLQIDSESRFERAREGDDWPSTTDAKGAFTLAKLARGTYSVHVSVPGGAQTTYDHAHAGDVLHLQLKPTAALEGQLRGAGSDVVTIRAEGARTGYIRFERFVHRDRYLISELAPDSYTLTVRSGQRVTQLTADVAEGARNTKDIDFDSGVAVSGRLIDLLTKRPLVNVTVYAAHDLDQLNAGSWSDDGHAKTDGAGRFTVRGLNAGEVEILAQASATFHFVTVIDGSHDVDLGGIAIAPRVPLDHEGELGIDLSSCKHGTPSTRCSLTVTSIAPDSVAAHADIRVGDVVTAIDGYDVRGTHESNAYTLLHVAPGTTIQLGLARGVTVALTAR